MPCAWAATGCERSDTFSVKPKRRGNLTGAEVASPSAPGPLSLLSKRRGGESKSYEVRNGPIV